MNGYDSYDEKQPVAWFRGHPIYAAYFVVIVFAVSMILTSLLLAAGQSRLLATLAFTSSDVLRGEVWRVVTYGSYNPPSISFAIDMLMIAFFGREVEKVVGGRSFLRFFAGVYLITPLLYTLIGLWRPTMQVGESGALAVFIAFAVYYPNVALYFGLLAKWIAVVIVGIYALMALAARDILGLAALLATTGFAYAYVRFQQGVLTLPSFRLPPRQAKLKVLEGGKGSTGKSPVKVSVTPRPARDITTSEMDALLDKIARSGMGSLTPEERARLDVAAKAHTQRKFGR